MRTINGKLVCETIEEVVAPGRTALVVVDVQNDFCSPGGQFDQIGKNLSGPRGMLPHLLALRRNCREFGVKTIFIKNTTLPNGQSDSPAWVYHMHRGGHRREDLPSYTLEGTWGQQFAPELEVGADERDIVIPKFRSSAFLNTNLAAVLRNNGVQTVLVTGLVTNGCILSTWRDALLNDFYSVPVSDCVSSYSMELHEAGMTIMSRGDVLTSEQLATIWKGQRN